MNRFPAIAFVLALVAVPNHHLANGTSLDKSPTHVERKGFAFTLPEGWREMRDDFCAPDGFHCFEHSRTGMRVTLVLGRRSAGARSRDLLNQELDRWRRRFAGRDCFKISEPRNAEEGVEVQGCSGSGRQILVRIRTLEGPKFVAVVTHFGPADRMESFAPQAKSFLGEFQLK